MNPDYIDPTVAITTALVATVAYFIIRHVQTNNKEN